MKKKYTHIFFDLDNTLWDFTKNSWLAMNVAFKKHLPSNGNNVDYNEFFAEYTKINHALWGEYRNQQVSKKELISLRFQKTFDLLSIKTVNPVEMNETYLAEMPLQTCLVPGAAETVGYLKSKGYNLNIISNGFREVQYKKLKQTGLLSSFNKVFLSEDVKVPKPGAGIFAHALKSVNARKYASIMIGDNWEVDVIGAFNYGMDAIYLCPQSPTESINEQVANHKMRLNIIGELLELKQFL